MVSPIFMNISVEMVPPHTPLAEAVKGAYEACPLLLIISIKAVPVRVPLS
jgi:hypothetical protein